MQEIDLALLPAQLPIFSCQLLFHLLWTPAERYTHQVLRWRTNTKLFSREKILIMLHMMVDGRSSPKERETQSDRTVGLARFW